MPTNSPLPSTKPSFSDQLHEIWRTRPMRLPDQGPFAGVAAGIGHRYGVDPILVRVAFVVSTIFGGAGVVLYLFAWLTFTKANDGNSAAEALFGKGHSSQSQTTTIVLIVALAIAVSTMGPLGIGMGGSGLISLVLMLGGWWLLHQRQPLPPPAPAMATGPIGYSTPTQSVREDTTVTDSQPEPFGPSPTPPDWDPLGAAPFAWDLPEPGPAAPPPAPRRPKSRLTTVVIGLAIIAAAATAAVGAMGAGWVTAPRVGAAALAVIGFGLIAGAFARRGHGLLVLVWPLIGFCVLASAVGPISVDGGRQWRPANVAELRPTYSIEGGGAVLDLRSIQLTKDTTVGLHARAAGVEVRVPSGMNVRTHCDLDFGGCPPEGLDGGTDGTNGPVLTLNIDGGFAGVEIKRG
ncbi:PspC domain-containing protein [Skermania sp. ID1734]|uniref:PspC domain-containing protein n=1 Tax=Skermania sp. ID1734 TaxID=2597516 RepID=UPI001180AA70|nr:PspC domain-containing protein [Skermania sp. ID1734]TSE02072.1 PspC domain-containing protein [Skermania sp. ID1734]